MSMKKDGWEFPAKISKRGQIQVPKKILELIDRSGDRDKIFITTIHAEEQ